MMRSTFKWTSVLLISVCLLISGCKSARYGQRLKANKAEYTRLIKPAKDPQRFGDSIELMINESVEGLSKTTSASAIKYSLMAASGATFWAAAEVLPVTKENKTFAIGVFVALTIVSAIDIVLTVAEPSAYQKKAIGAVSNWEHSRQDNSALTDLRAALFSLEETWPALAP